jgi:hypothetical protein
VHIKSEDICANNFSNFLIFLKYMLYIKRVYAPRIMSACLKLSGLEKTDSTCRLKLKKPNS